MKPSHTLLVALGLAWALCASAQVSFLTGGVGEDEQATLKAAQKDYPLSMTFSQGARGEWLSDVKVTITDKSGATVLDAVSKGPMMLVKLPPGDYSVSAEAGGRGQKRAAKVSAGGQTKLAFNWQG